jgi:hypothetical protein
MGWDGMEFGFMAKLVRGRRSHFSAGAVEKNTVILVSTDLPGGVD